MGCGFPLRERLLNAAKHDETKQACGGLRIFGCAPTRVALSREACSRHPAVHWRSDGARTIWGDHK